MRSILVAGGAGFIGSSFVRIAREEKYRILVYDKLTYAGSLENLKDLIGEGSDVTFIKGDICDFDLLTKCLLDHSIDAVVNFAAETHVDNSILGPMVFVQTNVIGTFTILEAVRHMKERHRKAIRYLHVSTDEVFGELGVDGKFSESSPYDPSSPYSATKASSDHLVRSWGRTYGLDTIITNCSNNYGPRQYPEKLIPKSICLALRGEPIPVYGKGENIRDWIYVDDHSRGIMLALKSAAKGSTYCFGGDCERKNIEVVKTICTLLDKISPRADGGSYHEQITFVSDRPGHDFRYSIEDSLAIRDLHFTRQVKSLEIGLESTINWYLKDSNFIKR